MANLKDKGVSPTKVEALKRMLHELRDLVACIETTTAEILGETKP